MSIYGDQTNIFATRVMIDANIIFIDIPRKKEVCKANFVISNGKLSITEATQDKKTFKFKISTEELSALWEKFIASTRTDNAAFSIAKITA